LKGLIVQVGRCGCAYGELDESKDEHGPEAAEVGVGEEAAEEGEEEDSADEVGDDVGRLRQREVHLPEHVRDQVVPHRRNRHHLEGLDACSRHTLDQQNQEPKNKEEQSKPDSCKQRCSSEPR
jgi:hypothetical protein